MHENQSTEFSEHIFSISQGLKTLWNGKICPYYVLILKHIYTEADISFWFCAI